MEFYIMKGSDGLLSIGSRRAFSGDLEKASALNPSDSMEQRNSSLSGGSKALGDVEKVK